jgi:hypothetical protein
MSSIVRKRSSMASTAALDVVFRLSSFATDTGYSQATLALAQFRHGFSPLHFVFFLRHSLQALTTLSLFLVGVASEIMTK